MLEPLHACNLTCTGCGRIREYETPSRRSCRVEECLASVDEAGAPIVSICGGEPMIYPRSASWSAASSKRRKHIYLCTNGMFIQKKLHEFQPDDAVLLQRPPRRPAKRRTTTPSSAKGVFEAAVEGIKAAKKAGFLVCTNTTVYKETDMAEIDALFAT